MRAPLAAEIHTSSSTSPFQPTTTRAELVWLHAEKHHTCPTQSTPCRINNLTVRIHVQMNLCRTRALTARARHAEPSPAAEAAEAERSGDARRRAQRGSYIVELMGFLGAHYILINSLQRIPERGVRSKNGEQKNKRNNVLHRKCSARGT